MTDLAELPAAFLENIDWVNQPPPPQARDTHALHFFLTNTGAPENPPTYQGFLFYRQGAHPTAPITGEQNGLDGTGSRIHGKVGLPDEAWARVQVRFRTRPTPRISVVVYLHQADGPDALPGTQVRLVGFDEADPSDDGRAILLDSGTSNRWQLNIVKTTVLL